MTTSHRDNYFWLDLYTKFICPTGDGSGPVANLFFLGLATLLGEKEPQIVRDGVELWEADPIDDLVIHGGGEHFGVEFTLPLVRELKRHVWYAFSVPFQDPPDLITINDRVCWRKDAAAKDGPVTAIFNWQANAPKAVLRLWCNGPEARLRFGNQSAASMIEIAAADSGPVDNSTWACPPLIKRFTVAPLYRQWLSRDMSLYPWPAAIGAVQWKTDDVGVIIDLNGLNELSIEEQAQNIQYLLRCHEFGKVGINGVFYLGNGWPTQTFGAWGHLPNYIAAGDLTPEDMDRFIRENGIEHIILETCQLGEWDGGNLLDFPSGYQPRYKLYSSLDTGRILQTRYPHVKVHFWIAEMRVQGALSDPRNRVASCDPQQQKLWGPDGRDQLYDYWNKHDRLLDAYATWHEQIRRTLPDPGRTLISMQSHGPWDCPVIAKAGADVVDSKGIHRQCIQPVVAAGRGTARHAGLKFQGELDSWHYAAYNTYGPEEVEQLYRLFYAAGCDSIYSQADLFGLDESHQVLPNTIGIAALKAIRWIRRHPRRGVQQVPFAVLAGDACTGAWGPSVIGDCWYSPRRRPTRPEHEDYELVNCFVPGMGHWWRGDYRHVFTGMPYGPLDIGPAKQALLDLGGYRLVVMAGWHGMTPRQYAAIERYVEQGGAFVCSLGQLKVRGEGDWINQGRAPVADTRPCFGVSMDRTGAAALAGAQVLLKDAAGAPLVTAKGNAYLVWRELCQDPADPQASREIRELVAGLAASRRAIAFAPCSPFLEVTMASRDDLLFLFVFNHGRIRQPSGAGECGEVYQGAIRLDRKLLSDGTGPLDVMHLSEEMELSPLEWRTEANEIVIPVTVDRLSEIVIGPRGQVAARLFEPAS